MTFTSVDTPGQSFALDQPGQARACRGTSRIALISQADKTRYSPRSTDQHASFPLPTFDFRRFDRNLFDVAANCDQDPYLLVLLAGQEFDDGREEQAACLIEAAFSAFDRHHVCHGVDHSD